MAAIARRTLLALLVAPAVADEIRDLLASMATDLSAGNFAGFIAATSKTMPRREQLRQWLAGMTSTYDVNNTVAVVSSSGDDKQHEAQVDWYLAGRSTVDNAIRVQRRETLKVNFVREGKRWRVAAIDPLEFFNPSAEN